jgi:hypothetical protein
MIYMCDNLPNILLNFHLLLNNRLYESKEWEIGHEQIVDIEIRNRLTYPKYLSFSDVFDCKSYHWIINFLKYKKK